MSNIQVETESREAILNEDYNNKQKDRVRREFKGMTHHKWRINDA